MNPSLIDEFVTRGFVVFRNAFDQQVAACCGESVLERCEDPALDIARETGYVHIKESFDGEPFSSIWTPRLATAIDTLLAPAAYIPPDVWGWWPISLPGFAKGPVRIPEIGWHIDGTNSGDRHRLNDREAVILLGIFTPIDTWGGGTFIEIGSHLDSLRAIVDERDGIAHQDLNTLMNSRSQKGQVVEMTGQPGDMVIMHPLVWHCRGMNFGERTRIICNQDIALINPKNIETRPDALAIAIRSATGSIQ